MSQGETLVEMARRHVREGEEHVRRQRELIERLWEHRLPIDEAERLLANFEEALEEHRAGLNRIIEEQHQGLRDEAGDLITSR